VKVTLVIQKKGTLKSRQNSSWYEEEPPGTGHSISYLFVGRSGGREDGKKQESATLASEDSKFNQETRLGSLGRGFSNKTKTTANSKKERRP